MTERPTLESDMFDLVKDKPILTNTPRVTDLPGSRERSIETLLTEREKTHGDFTEHAAITQELKDCMRRVRPEGWKKLTNVQKEALDMNAHKLGRILAGDPNFRDHWDDIAGYAKLVAERCSK